MQATASGMLSVYFYDTLAGSQPLEPTTIAARANPQVASCIHCPTGCICIISTPQHIVFNVLNTVSCCLRLWQCCLQGPDHPCLNYGSTHRGLPCSACAHSTAMPSGQILRMHRLLACLMKHGVEGWLLRASTEVLGWMQVVEVNIDASDVPSEYALTILSECAAFPRRLVFFLKGTLSVRCPVLF